jgi:hypothetical protein
LSIYLADVSEFQPDINDTTYIGWSHGIVIRAAYGDSHTDGAWYGGARRSGLHAAGIEFLGIYQYLVAGQSGTAQAQAFQALVGPIQDGEVFVADFEEGSQPMLTDWYNEMISLYGPGISSYLWTYTGLSFGETEGILPVQWIADYTATEPSTSHILWQFTDAYNVPGVGTCDCNSYDGTMAQLAALTWGGAASFHVTTNAPGTWTGQVTVSGGGTGGPSTWYTATVNGTSWTTPSMSEPALTPGSGSYTIRSKAPGTWTGTIVLAGAGSSGGTTRWHTSTDDGANWSTPRT